MVENPNPLSPINFLSLGQNGAHDLISLPFDFYHLGAALSTSSILGHPEQLSVFLDLSARTSHGG
ncbi:hypothetical protein U9M48_028723 [Paspalum notatum var. saurae]|uniref:Uncharacterized protein n=1 Tax=Paspalum notatum var. saurae TaxID=547442 RepID=A0AAQ3TXC7_PASNO